MFGTDGSPTRAVAFFLAPIVTYYAASAVWAWTTRGRNDSISADSDAGKGAQKTLHQGQRGKSKPASSWSASRVLEFFTMHPDLLPLRSEPSRLNPSAFHDVDGEILLDMTEEDFIRKGVKRYHVSKVNRVLNQMKTGNDNLRAIDTKKCCRDNVISSSGDAHRKIGTTPCSLKICNRLLERLRKVRKNTEMHSGQATSTRTKRQRRVSLLAANKIEKYLNLHSFRLKQDDGLLKYSLQESKGAHTTTQRTGDLSNTAARDRTKHLDILELADTLEQLGLPRTLQTVQEFIAIFDEISDDSFQLFELVDIVKNLGAPELSVKIDDGSETAVESAHGSSIVTIERSRPRRQSGATEEIRRSSRVTKLPSSTEEKLHAYLTKRVQSEMGRMSRFKAAIHRVRMNLKAERVDIDEQLSERRSLPSSEPQHHKKSLHRASFPDRGRQNRSTHSRTVNSETVKNGIRRLQKTPRKFRIDEKTRWLRGEVIGVGAFGRVYFGLSEKTGVMMAVKEIRCPDDAPAEELQGLVSEISMLKKLVHENIVGYLGARIEREHFLYIFTQWVPGGSIESLLERFGALTHTMVMNYTVQILRGLEYLHEENVVHRDIKSANILVDENGVIKLSDFGTCKRLQEIDRTRNQGYNRYNLMEHQDVHKQAKQNLRRKHSFAGTPFYMAPEVMLQEAYDQSADIWSVGCTVLHMSTNKRPWSEKKFKTLPQLMIHLKKTHQTPEIPYQLPEPLRKFISRCFIRNQEDRPPASRLLQDAFLKSSYLLKSHSGQKGDESSESSSSSDEDDVAMREMQRKIKTRRHDSMDGIHMGARDHPTTSKDSIDIDADSTNCSYSDPDFLSIVDQEIDETCETQEGIESDSRAGQGVQDPTWGSQFKLDSDGVNKAGSNPSGSSGNRSRHGSSLARKTGDSEYAGTHEVDRLQSNPFDDSGNLSRHGSSLGIDVGGGESGKTVDIYGSRSNPFSGSGNLSRHGSSLVREICGDEHNGSDDDIAVSQSNPFGGSGNLSRHGSSLARDIGNVQDVETDDSDGSNLNPFGGARNLTRHGSSLAGELED